MGEGLFAFIDTGCRSGSRVLLIATRKVRAIGMPPLQISCGSRAVSAALHEEKKLN
jgi:hypothetical protein